MTAPIDTPVPGPGLLDRLTASSGAAQPNGTARTQLRPLLPYFADASPAGSAEDPELPETTVAARSPPMQQTSHTSHAPQPIDARRASNAAISPSMRGPVVEPVVQHASSGARPNERAPVAVLHRNADSRNATSSDITTKHDLPSTLSDERHAAALSPVQARAATEPRLPNIELSSRASSGSSFDLHAFGEPDHEPQPAPLMPLMPRHQAALEPTRGILRSRDGSSTSSLPRAVAPRAEPTIEIHIGRIDVRAQTAACPAAASAQRAAAPSPHSLAAHLGARARGARS